MNCTRVKAMPSIERERALARVVLPVPGTSSKRIWPPQNRQTAVFRMTSSLPLITCPTEAIRRSAADCREKGVFMVMAPFKKHRPGEQGAPRLEVQPSYEFSFLSWIFRQNV